MNDNIPAPLTPLGGQVLEYMQQHDETYIGAELTAKTGIKGVHGVLQGLVFRGLVEKSMVIRTVVNGKGIAKEKECIGYTLTAKGRQYN